MISKIVVYITYFVLAFSAAWCAWNFKRLRMEFRVLAVFIFLSAGIQAGAEVAARFGINNLFLSHLYAVLGVVALAGFYRLLLRRFIPDAVFIILIAGFVTLAVATVLLWEPLDTFNSIPLTAEAVVFIIFALSTFILTLNENMNHQLREILRSLNWINSGILLYFTGSLLLFYNGETIIHAIIGRWSVYTWLIHAALTIILHTCLLIGLWLSPKT